jgi:HK97 family phage portal protein
MGLLDRVDAVRAERSFATGPADVMFVDEQFGFDKERFGPESYGDYIATSNEIYSVVNNLRAKPMAGLPLRLWTGDDEKKKEVTSGPLRDLLTKVNPFWTSLRLWWQTELSLCLWGESFMVVERGGSRIPQELWWVKPPFMRPVPHPDNYISGFLYDGPSGEQLAFAPDEVIWLRYPNPIDQFVGLSPLAAARLAADVGSAAMQSNKNLFKDGWQIGGFVGPKAAGNRPVTFSPEQADELQEKLEQRHAGADKAHRWGVLRFDANVQQMGITPKDAEYLGSLNMTLKQVCNAYGVPSVLLNDLEHATLANVNVYQRQLWDMALMPELRFLESELEEQLLPMFGMSPGRQTARKVSFDTSKVSALQEAESAVWDRERQQVEVGSLTINEWRKKYGMPPVAWGDVWWCPVNKAPVDSAEINVPDVAESAPSMPDELELLVPSNGNGSNPSS